MHRPLVAVAVVSVILLLGDVLALATVRGGSHNQSGVVQTLAAAGAATVSAKTARYSSTVSTTVEVGSRPETVLETTAGLIDFTNRDSQITITSGGQKSEVRTVGGVTYIEEPAAVRAQLKVKTPWVSLPPSRSAQTSGDPTGSFGELLGSIQSTATHAKRAGTLVIGGVTTTAYTLQLKTSVLNALASAASARVTVAGVSSSHISSLLLSVWVDGQGRIRRVDNVIHSTVTVSGQKLSEVSTTSALFTDFGIAVHIPPPPANQVTATNSSNALVPAGN